MKHNRVLLTALLLLLPLTFSCGLMDDIENTAPRIREIEVSSGVVDANEVVTVNCIAEDDDGDFLYYYWRAEAGIMTSYGTASNIEWEAPAYSGMYKLEVEVSDEYDSAFGVLYLLVVNGEALPDTLILLTPANGATGIGTSAYLSWSFDGSGIDELYYSVYLGTDDNPALYQAGLEDSHFEVEGLLLDTTYFWRVTVLSGETELYSSDTFSFSTMTSIISDYQSIFPLEVGNVRAKKGIEINGYYDWDREVAVRDTNDIVDTTRIVESALGLTPEEGVLAYRLVGSEIDAWFAHLSYGIYCRNSSGTWFEWDALIDYPQPSGTVLEESGDGVTWIDRLWVQNADTTVTVNGVTYENCYVVNKYEYPYYGTNYRFRERVYARGVGVVKRVITIADRENGEFGDFYQEIKVLDRLYNIYDEE